MMHHHSVTAERLIQQIAINNADRNYTRIRVLILYDFQGHYIGDTICRLCYLKLVRHFLQGAEHIEFNCPNSVVSLLVRNNVYVDKVSTLALNELALHEYDLVLVTYIEKEQQLLQLLLNRYEASVLNGSMRIRIYSVSRFLDKEWHGEPVFPVFDQLGTFINRNYSNVQKELFITPEERDQAREYLRENGLGPEEKLIVVVDDTTRRDKMLRPDVFFQLVQYLLNMPLARVLIYDDKGIGKRAFYVEWLGEELIDRLIFVEKTDLRKSIALLAIEQVKMVLGPCTGLMHCASAIYQNYIACGMSLQDIPLIIVVAGKEINDTSHKWDWWGNDCAHCLVIRKADTGGLAICEIDQYINDYLACNKFNAEMIIDFLEKKFRRELKHHQLV
jgi:ADP-heptose:LPS heptosyltransferase